MSSVIFLWGKYAHKRRCGRQRSWLKPPDCDCWVGGERFGFPHAKPNLHGLLNYEERTKSMEKRRA